jgi:hypothetical protein
MENTPPPPGLGRREDRVRLLVGHRHARDDVEELALGLGRDDPVHLVGHPLDDLRQRRRVLGQVLAHDRPRPLLDRGNQLEQLLALARVRHVVADGGAQHRIEVLRAVGERRVGTDRDALHALRAVLGNVERRLAARDVLRRRVAAAGRHDADRRVGVRRLVVAQPSAEERVELLDPRDRRPIELLLGGVVRAAAGPAAVAVGF